MNKKTKIFRVEERGNQKTTEKRGKRKRKRKKYSNTTATTIIETHLFYNN